MFCLTVWVVIVALEVDPDTRAADVFGHPPADLFVIHGHGISCRSLRFPSFLEGLPGGDKAMGWGDGSKGLVLQYSHVFAFWWSGE